MNTRNIATRPCGYNVPLYTLPVCMFGLFDFSLFYRILGHQITFIRTTGKKRILSVHSFLPVSFENQSQIFYSPPSKHTRAEIKVLLPKLSIHCPNSVHVAGVYTYAILAFQVHVSVCNTMQATYFFTLKTIDHLDLLHPTPSYCNLSKQEHLLYASGI